MRQGNWSWRNFVQIIIQRHLSRLLRMLSSDWFTVRMLSPDWLILTNPWQAVTMDNLRNEISLGISGQPAPSLVTPEQCCQLVMTMGGSTLHCCQSSHVGGGQVSLMTTGQQSDTELRQTMGCGPVEQAVTRLGNIVSG